MAGPDGALWTAYKLRWRRRRLLIRSMRKAGRLRAVSDRTDRIAPGDVLAFATVRNEGLRLPYWLAHHRALGVRHFLIVDNGSDDGSAAMLAGQGDVSLWSTGDGYKAARFGVDWLTVLMRRHGHGHWCLTLDADEVLVYPEHDVRPLPELTAWLRRRSIPSFGALMLDLYPDGPLDAARYAAGDPVTDTLTHFDAWGYLWERQPKYRNISIRGGPRRRSFFADAPDHAPHLHKVPLIDWRRSYAYVSSTHVALPRRLNDPLDARLDRPTGVLLHSKFLPDIGRRSADEKLRAEHFTHPERYGAYYDALTEGPVLTGAPSMRYEGWRQLEALGLMTRGAWG